MEEITNREEKKPLSIGNWYLTFMYLSIPLFGWIYLIILSKSKKQPLKQEFAKAFLLYKLTILGTCTVLTIIFAIIIFPYVDQLLTYMEML